MGLGRADAISAAARTGPHTLDTEWPTAGLTGPARVRKR